MPRKHPLPPFLANVVTPDAYERWLSRKAAAHVKRDRKRGYACSNAIYKQAIHAAVLRSEGVDAYTGEALDWSLISTYENEASREGRHAYKAGFALLPTVDHFSPGSSDASFRICAWRTNDAKNDLPVDAFIDLCKKLVTHAGFLVFDPNEETATAAVSAAAPGAHAWKNSSGNAMNTSCITIDQIIEQLARHRQRATYGAVAGVLGRLPRSVMSGRPKTQENCWVVSVSAGLPTGYGEQDMHPDLLSRSEILSTAEELRAWLRSPR